MEMKDKVDNEVTENIHLNKIQWMAKTYNATNPTMMIMIMLMVTTMYLRSSFSGLTNAVLMRSGIPKV